MRHTQNGMTKRTKQFLIGTGIFFGLVLCLLTAVVLYFKTNHAHRFIQAKTNEAIPGSLDFETLRFSLIKSEFELRNVALRDPSQEAVAGFERLFVDFSWLPLFKGAIRIKAMVLEKPWANVQFGRDGRLNLLEAFPSSEVEAGKKEPETGNGALPNVVLDSVKIIGGAARYETADPALKAVIGALDLFAEADLARRSGKLSMELGQIDLNSPGIQIAVDKFKLSLALEEGRIDPLVWEVKTPSSELVLTGHIAGIFEQPIVDVALHIAASLSELQETLYMKKGMEGQLGLRMAARGTLDNPDIGLQLDLEGGKVSGTRIERAVMDCRLEDRILVLDRLQIDGPGGAIHGNGEADFSSAFPRGFLGAERDLEALSYKVLLEGKEVRLAKLFTADGMSGRANARISIEGRGLSAKTGTAQMVLDISVHEFNTDRFEEPIALNVKGEANLDHGKTTLKNLEAKAGSLTLHSKGHFDLQSKELLGELFLEAPDLKEALEPFGLKQAEGALYMEAHASGSAERPVFDWTLKGDRLCFQDIVLGSIKLAASLDPSGILNISNLSVENGGSSLTGQGTVHIFEKENLRFLEDPSFSIKMEGERISIQDFLDPFEGSFSLRADLEGSVKKPHGTLAVRGTDLNTGSQKLHGLTLNARLDGEKIRLDPLKLDVTPDEGLEATGWLSTDKTFELTLVSKGISLQNIDKLREEQIAQGTIVLEVAAKGTVEDPRIEGQIVFQQLHLMGKPMEDFHVGLHVLDHTARVSGSLNFDIEASYHLKEKDFSAILVFKETDLAPYFMMADQPDFSGFLTGTIDVSGNAAAVDEAAGTVQLSRVNIYFQEKALVSGDDITASFNRDEIRISDLRVMVLDAGYIDVRGRARRDGTMAFDVDADIPLPVISLFVEDLSDISGNLVVAGTVTGTRTAPKMQGDIAFKAVAFTVPGLLQKVDRLNGRMVLGPQKLTIQGMEGQLDSGRFELAGTVGHEAFQPVSVDLKFNGDVLPVDVPDTMQLFLSTGLRVHGTREKSVIEGEIVILEGSYYRDVNLSLLDAVGKKKRKVSEPPSEIKHPFLKNMVLDISVQDRNPFMVQNNLAELSIRPDLRITGKLNNPVVSGRAEVASGTVHYRKKNFAVKRGVVDFLNPYKTEPTIDIESEVKVRHWLIVLAVSGTPDELTFKLTSEPPEEDGDILSLLLIGKTTRELIDGEGGTSRGTSQMLAAALASTFADDVKEVTGLDIVEAETGGEEDPDRIKVTLGEELSKRMTVKYAVESKDGEMIQRAIAEYKLFENILLGGFQDTRGIFGGQLQFRLEFR